MPTFPTPFMEYDEGRVHTPLTLADLRLQKISYTLRSKPSWWAKYKNPEILAKWRAEIVKYEEEVVKADRLSDQEIDYVLAELAGYDKMRDETTGIEQSCYARVYQSDRLIPDDLLQRLKDAVKPLENVPEDQKDWHPRSDDQVLDLVHPSLYCGVYGRTLSYPVDLDPSDRKPIDLKQLNLEDHGEHTTQPYSIARWAVSNKFTWIPTDFEISKDGSSARALGYINNINPTRNFELYKVVESLVSRFSFLWDRVLTDLHPENPVSYRITDAYDWGEDESSPEPMDYDFDDYDEFLEAREKWEKNRPFIRPSVPAGGYAHDISEREEIYSVQGRKIQVFVKLANIILTPENPEYPGGSWHIEGMMNERIVASGIYYYDSENITESQLAFRAAVGSGNIGYMQDDKAGVKLTYGLDRSTKANQVLGAVETTAGRCIAFPNTYQHQVSSFELDDPSKPGHRKIVALFLVDPEYTIPSTSHIAPQQSEWAQEAMNATGTLFSKLPLELLDMVSKNAQTEGALMTLEEAQQYRLELMDERGKLSVQSPTLPKQKLQMLVIRADDGESFETGVTLLDVERTKPSLKAYLSEVTGFQANAILCFLSDGTQLRNENLRELAGVEDQTLYVFNREYLDLPVDQILSDLLVEPQLQPDVDAQAHQSSPPLLLSAYSRAANFHYQHLVQRAASMAAQCAALVVASRNLDSHVLALTSAYEAFSASAQRELEKQDEVLRGHATDMEIIGRIKVHRDFLSPAIRRAVDAGGQDRRLGDYVNAHKMQQVADTSVKLHEELVQRFNTAQAQIYELTTGSDEVRTGTVNPFAAEVEELLQQAKETSDRITGASLDISAEEIQELDALLRDDVQTMAEYKNQLTTHCVHVVRQVSKLQSILADLPSDLATLEADLRAKAGFPHLQRLHNMLYFYGATIVEIVRRKEFAKLFTERAQTIAEMMAKLTANERKRRQVYRSEVHKQLPFEPKGMDDPAPALEISTTGSQEPPFSITRDDLIDFLGLVDEISETVAVPVYGEGGHGHSGSQSTFIHPAREVRTTLDKLISRIDTLESDFDKLAEKSNSNEVSASAYREAIEQLRGKAEQERQLLEDRGGLESENHRLTSELHAARGERDAAIAQASEQSQTIESLEEDLQVLRDQLASESAARRSLEQRHGASLAETLNQAKTLEAALAEATKRTKEAEKLKCELSTAKDETARVRELHEASDRRIAALLEEQAATLRHIEEAKAHGEDLKAQLRVAVDDSQEASRALKLAAAENERILRDRASEADRALRDQVAEADGDRAVLEHQLTEARNQLQQRSSDISELRVELEIRRADQARVEEDLNALERHKSEQESSFKRQIDNLKREVEEGRSAIIELRRRMVAQERVTSEIIKVAMRMRDVNARTMTNAQKYILGPRHSSANAAGAASTGADDFVTASLMMSTTSNSTLAGSQFISSSSFPPSTSSSVHAVYPSQSLALNGDGQPSIDPSSPEKALAGLAAFNLDGFTDTMNKTGSTIRKWQKQCKEYRERARGKIAYRNFQKGDLALFLPTRNSETRPWAAFN
ncbi:oligomeric, coiled-coil, peripheral membrane protein, partial [Tulasnella sp. 427]